MSLFVRNQGSRSELQIKIAAELQDRLKSEQLRAVQEPPTPVKAKKQSTERTSHKTLYLGITFIVFLILAIWAVTKI